MSCRAVCILLLLVAPARVAAVTDLGTVGAIYPVVEKDIRQEMQQKAVRDWEEQKKAFKEKIRSYQPANLQHLPRSRENKTFLVDMAYTLDRDLNDQNGNVVYPRGYTFNPLDYTQLSIGLVVIDGNDSAQVAWYKASPYLQNHKVKLLLSDGSAADLMKEFHRAVFYLDKNLASRLKLTAVPCIALQHDRNIHVTEFLIEEGK